MAIEKAHKRRMHFAWLRVWTVTSDKLQLHIEVAAI